MGENEVLPFEKDLDKRSDGIHEITRLKSDRKIIQIVTFETKLVLLYLLGMTQTFAFQNFKFL